MKVHLGCGNNYMSGWTNVDIDKRVRADIYHDLNKPLPFADNSVEEIYTAHTLEHLDDIFAIMREIHRVLLPNGTVTIIVPHWTHPWAFGDLSHKRYFNELSFDTFCENIPTGRVYQIDFYFNRLEHSFQQGGEVKVKLQVIK